MTNHSLNQTEGRWTAEEQQLFAQGYELFGRNWKKIASLVKTRNNVQCRTHAQHLQRKRILGTGGISPAPRDEPAAVTTYSTPTAAMEKGQRLILASFRQKLAEQRFLLAKLQFHYMQQSQPPLSLSAPA